jgi:hypothetical protein
LEQRLDNGKEQRQAEHGDGNVAQRTGIDGRAREMAIAFIDAKAYETTPNESDGDVAGIVDAQIEARIAVEE